MPCETQFIPEGKRWVQYIISNNTSDRLTSYSISCAYLLLFYVTRDCLTNFSVVRDFIEKFCVMCDWNLPPPLPPSVYTVGKCVTPSHMIISSISAHFRPQIFKHFFCFLTLNLKQLIF